MWSTVPLTLGLSYTLPTLVIKICLHVDVTVYSIITTIIM